MRYVEHACSYKSSNRCVFANVWNLNNSMLQTIIRQLAIFLYIVQKEYTCIHTFILCINTRILIYSFIKIFLWFLYLDCILRSWSMLWFLLVYYSELSHMTVGIDYISILIYLIKPAASCVYRYSNYTLVIHLYTCRLNATTREFPRKGNGRQWWLVLWIINLCKQVNNADSKSIDEISPLFTSTCYIDRH